MRFLTWANDPADPRCELLFASARHFGIDVEPIGVGKPYYGGICKAHWLWDWIRGKSRRDELYVCVDAFDCIFLREWNDSEDMDRKAAYSDVVFAGERWYRNKHPDSQKYFDTMYGTRLYRYPNCGTVMGNSIALAMLYGFVNRLSLRYANELFEQWHMTKAIADLKYPRCVDTLAEYFYCCGGEWRRFAGEVVDGRFRNKRTGKYPFILHAPMPRRSLPIRERIAKELGII